MTLLEAWERFQDRMVSSTTQAEGDAIFAEFEAAILAAQGVAASGTGGGRGVILGDSMDIRKPKITLGEARSAPTTPDEPTLQLSGDRGDLLNAVNALVQSYNEILKVEEAAADAAVMQLEDALKPTADRQAGPSQEAAIATAEDAEQLGFDAADASERRDTLVALKEWLEHPDNQNKELDTAAWHALLE